MRFWIALISFVVGVARAQDVDHPRVRLAYDAPVECPEVSGFRERISGRLGYDPFDDAAPDELRVTIRNGFAARIELEGAVRELGPVDSCSELATAAAVTVSIMLDPLADPTPPVVTPPPPPPPPPPTPPPTPSPMPIESLIVVEAGGALGHAPTPSFEGGVRLGVSIGDILRIEGGIRGRSTLVEVAVDTELVRLSTWAGSISGCARYQWLLGCAEVEIGVDSGESSTIGTSAIVFFGAAGLRGGVELRVAPSVALRALLSVWVPFTELRLRNDGRTIWEAPPIAGGLIVGAAFFPGSF